MALHICCREDGKQFSDHLSISYITGPGLSKTWMFQCQKHECFSVRRLVVLLMHRYTSKLRPDSDHLLLPPLPWQPSFLSLKWWWQRRLSSEVMLNPRIWILQNFPRSCFYDSCIKSTHPTSLSEHSRMQPLFVWPMRRHTKRFWVKSFWCLTTLKEALI